jgi:BCD family chlorophyll transporter-like MFS transporter
MTPGQSTSLSGVHHGGVLLGMLLVALTGTLLKNRRGELLRFWMIGGCVASALALISIAFGGFRADHWPLTSSVLALGIGNGAFAVAAIATMMALAGRGRGNREGLRMGLWGAAQAIAFALGGFAGTVAIDVTRIFLQDPTVAYATVFLGEAMLFVAAAMLGIGVNRSAVSSYPSMAVGDADFIDLAREKS